MLSIVGGSGTGKTVLLRQMLGLLEPTKGRVEVLGRPASEMGREGAASRVGMLFQHGALYSAFSVLDNVAFALREQARCPTIWCATRPWSSCRWWASSPSMPRACRPISRAA